ncbi:MAG: hypothetical protein ACWGQW_14905, partial [bacterium]
DVPGSTILKDRLEVYITQASAKNSGISFDDPDEADTKYALYLAFHAAWLVAVARPSMENAQVPVLGSETYSKDQRDALYLMWNEYLDEYNVLLAQVPTTEVAKGLSTHSTDVEYDW